MKINKNVWLHANLAPTKETKKGRGIRTLHLVPTPLFPNGYWSSFFNYLPFFFHYPFILNGFLSDSPISIVINFWISLIKQKKMVRSRSSANKWKYINPSYYLKRPKRLALLFIVFVFGSFFFWDRQTLVRDHQVRFSLLTYLIVTFFFLIEGWGRGNS